MRDGRLSRQKKVRDPCGPTTRDGGGKCGYPTLPQTKSLAPAPKESPALKTKAKLKSPS